MKQDKLKLAYYAGFIDGEGSFIVIKRNYPNGRFKQGVQLSGKITVSNTYKPVLEEMQEYFDEGCVWKNNRGIKNHKIGYRFDISRFDGIIKTIEQLLPFLKEKKERAEILLQFCKRRKSLCTKKGKGHPYIVEDFEDYFLMRKLNKRGTTPYRRGPTF